MSRMMEEPSGTASRLVINTIFHPIDYAKILIQIGHEPLPPRPTVTIFGRPALALPNIFQYVRYIKSVDGFLGCYRGLVPKLCSRTLHGVVHAKAAECVEFPDEPNKFIDEEQLNETERRNRYIYTMIRQVISQVAAVIVCHPLDVICIRMMAQFVGRETRYSGLLTSIVEVYRDSGFAGYYSGLIPRLIGDTVSLVFIGSASYVLNRYFIRDHELRTFTIPTIGFLTSTVLYPFLVVSHCMAVNNCGLVAGMPPNMPIYQDWTECWRHLWTSGEIKRGSSLLWRYYKTPRTYYKTDVAQLKSM